MRLNFRLLNLSALALTGLLFSTSCTEDNVQPGDNSQLETRGSTLPGGIPPSTPLYGLSAENEIVSLFSGPPAYEVGSVAISGLRSEEYVIAIDTRPKTKQIFGVTNLSMLYVIDPVTGIATVVSGAPFTPAINGSTVGLDFSPQDDVLRLITDQGQAVRVSPTTGAVVGIDFLVSPTPQALPINSVAFSFSTRTARSSIYDIDAIGGNLYRQSSANGGTLILVGATGYNFSGEGGFEITPRNAAFAVQYGSSRTPQPAPGGLSNQDDTTQEAYRLFSINLGSGQATSLGKVRPMIGLASR